MNRLAGFLPPAIAAASFLWAAVTPRPALEGYLLLAGMGALAAGGFLGLIHKPVHRPYDGFLVNRRADLFNVELGSGRADTLRRAARGTLSADLLRRAGAAQNLDREEHHKPAVRADF